jgi:hypothetical protein
VKQRAYAAAGLPGVIEDSGRRQINEEPERPDRVAQTQGLSWTNGQRELITAGWPGRESEGDIVAMIRGNA